MNMLDSVHGLGLATVPLTMFPLANAAQYFFGILLSITSVFLILLILIQRGRGGGLAGAFGGMGGQSAFGTKAGDTFTRITIVVSVVWILICVFSVMFLSTSKGPLGKATPIGETNIDVTPAERSESDAGLPATSGASESGGAAGATDTGAPAAGSSSATPADTGATSGAAGPTSTENGTGGAAAEVDSPAAINTPAETPSAPATGTNP